MIEFLNENRSRLVKPVVFLIITSLIYTVLNNIFHFEDDYINYSFTPESSALKLLYWIQNNYGYANIIVALFIGLWLKKFFKKHQYNFFEILIVLCFVMGVGMLIYSVFGIIEGLTHVKTMIIGIIVGFIYTTYAVGQFFDKSKLISYVKAFMAYILGMMTLSFIIAVIGIIFGIINHK